MMPLVRNGFGKSSSRKRMRGQALLELLGIIPPFLLLLSVLVIAGWWTYSRMNAISRSYFMMTQLSSHNHFGLDVKDEAGNDITTGRPYWDRSGAYGSESTVHITEGLSSKFRLLDVFLTGVIVPFNTSQVPENNYGCASFACNPVLEKYGNPKSTLSGSFCLYCSDDLSRP